MFQEGTALESLESVDSRRFLPHALLATLLVIVAPALVVLVLSPLSGIADLVLSAVLAMGLSVAAGTVGSAAWTRLPQSREIPFADLMLWAWARRVRAERRLAKATAGGAPLGRDGELAGLRTLAVVFEARDGLSHGHSGRVARHAQRIARRMGLSSDEVERIEAAAAVHDVGMLRVPSAVLARDELSPKERRLVEHHAVAGADQVSAVAGPETAALVRHHHERVDGGGYPDGLAGDEIPLGARIIAVADRFDELVSGVAGRPRSTRGNALDELSARAGSELDAAVVAAFVGYYSGLRSIAGVALAATAPQRAVRWIAAAPATIGSAAGAPVLLQGACVAGTAALAGACIGGLPALSPDRDDRAAAKQQAERGPAGKGRHSAGPSPAGSGSAGDDLRGGKGRGESRAGPPSAGDDLAAPRSGAPQAPSSARGDRRVASAPSPTSPQPDGGGDAGGNARRAPIGGGAGGGGSGVPATPTPVPAPAQPPQQVELPPSPVDPTTQILDPVLDGLGDAVPPAKPVTDGVKGLVGGLTGGPTGGSGEQ
ncbi:MAG TPA: HD domain-containing phosphohydrolase [Thermoleophilaceae bacterium]|nr:HD domain-containing phosphohydrolase [Thermoleophilaceae bacterium]